MVCLWLGNIIVFLDDLIILYALGIAEILRIYFQIMQNCRGAFKDFQSS